MIRSSIRSAAFLVALMTFGAPPFHVPVHALSSLRGWTVQALNRTLPLSRGPRAAATQPAPSSTDAAPAFPFGEPTRQVPNPPAQRLVNATAVQCVFTTVATGTWKDAAVEAAVRPVTLALAFTSVDTQDGTADAVDGNRKAHVSVRVVGNYMNFIQLDPYGAIYVTTVFNTERKAGRLLAVHTRHEYTPVQLPGLTSRPEQYYGDCHVK